MIVDIEVVSGTPSAEEAAAVIAAVQALLGSETATALDRPWAYCSAWRRAAIEEGIRGADVP